MSKLPLSSSSSPGFGGQPVSTEDAVEQRVVAAVNALISVPDLGSISHLARPQEATRGHTAGHCLVTIVLILQRPANGCGRRDEGVEWWAVVTMDQWRSGRQAGMLSSSSTLAISRPAPCSASRRAARVSPLLSSVEDPYPSSTRITRTSSPHRRRCCPLSLPPLVVVVVSPRGAWQWNHRSWTLNAQPPPPCHIVPAPVERFGNSSDPAADDAFKDGR